MGKRILIVEDTRTIPEVIKVYLLGNDYEYMYARNGEEGVRTATAEKPDLIISDIKMPVKDGFELCEEVKSDPRTRDIPVILLTSLTDQESRREGRRTGADAFLNKPINANELLDLVRSFLR